MVSIVNNYPLDHCFYQDLPGLHTASTVMGGIVNFDEMMLSLGNLFMKHGMTKTLGVCLLHRHFDMKPNERLVERQEGDCFISSPSDRTNPAVAQSWGLDELGNTYPYEFAHDDENVVVLDESDDKFIAFAKEYSTLLKGLGLIKVFGFRIRNFKMNDEKTYIEDTVMETRQNIIKEFDPSVEDEPTYSKVFWVFDVEETDSGETVPIWRLRCNCRSYCTNDCHGCA